MSYYFYDLETSGINPRWSRIVQFAGQRTDDDFNPIGQPDNWLVKLTPDILPDPYAVMVTGITPQKTIEEGYTEAEFLELLHQNVFLPNTTMLGYNTLRFDDEFMRFTLYRNFYDPYEREWRDGASRWDIVDLVRMTRALRPKGIEWAVTSDGKPTNRLELLSKANQLEHTHAHDALSDVYATIDIARLVKRAQPKLYNHLRSIKGKKQVAGLLESLADQPIVHTSGRYSSSNLGTSVVAILGPHPSNNNAVLAYDLRYSPRAFAESTPKELAHLAFTPSRQLKKGEFRLPVKAIHLNKSPALAPISVLDEASQARINLTRKQVTAHHQELKQLGDFYDRMRTVFEQDNFTEIPDVDTQLYGGFVSDADKSRMQQVRVMSPEQLADYQPNFNDERLQHLLLRYRARNFPHSLDKEDGQLWEQFRAQRLTDTKYAPYNMNTYMSTLAKLAQDEQYQDKQFLLEELQLYAESIAPFENQTLL